MLLCITAAAQTFEISPQGGAAPPPAESPGARTNRSKPRAQAPASSGLGWGSNIEVARQSRAAETALQKGDYATAAQYAQRAANAAPHDSHLWFLLGYAARLSGSNTLSVSAFNRGLQETPGAVEGLSGLAQTYIKMGKTDEAKKLLQQVLAANPRRPADLNVIGELYLSTGDAQQALTYLRRADALQPAPRPELLMALAYKRLNQPDQAKAMLERARSKAPRNPEVLRSVAGYYRDTHDYKQAIAALQQIPNKNADILGELAYTYQLSGDTKAAAGTYAAAANAAPQQINLQLAAAQAQLNADSLDAAAPFLARAQNLDANNYRLHALRGEIAKRQDRYQDAIKEYTLALASMPEGPQEGVLYPVELRMSLAQMYRAAGDEASTQKQFQLAKAGLDQLQVEGPQKATYLLLRGEVRTNLGDLAGANQDLAQAVALEPDNPDFLLQYGSVLWKMKRLPDAKQAYQKVLTLDASNRWALTSLGYLSRELNDNKGAENYFKKLAVAYPKDYVPYLALGDLYTSERQFSKAQSVYETGYKLSPENPLIVAGGANAGIESHQFPVAARWLARAHGEMNQEPHLMRERERYLTWTGKYDESAALGYQVIKKLPRDRDAVVYLGYDLLHLGRYDDLLALTSDFEKVLPKEPDLPLLAGYVHKRSNLLHEALDDFTRTIERGPTIVTAYINRGYVLNDMQNAEEASADFHKAIKLEPKNGEAHLGLAFAQLELHHGRAALSEAELAEKYMGENGSVYVAKATAYRQAGLLQQAEKAYRAALKYNPDDLQLTMALADTLYHLRRYDDSVKVLNAALALDPDDPYIYAQMAQAKSELKERADTFKYVEAAERSGGDESGVLLATGDALLTLGDHDAAMQRFERALDAPDSDRVQARLHIAKVMQRDGHWDDAREQVALSFAESRIGEASPLTPENMMEAGDIFLRMHDFDLAQRLFTRARSAGAADQVVAVALANTYLAQGETQNAEMELASLGNPADNQENYDYMLARANLLRQQHQDVRALSAFAHANNVSGEDDIAERELLNLAGQEGYQITQKVSVASDLTVSPVFDDATVYMQESRIRGLSDGSNLLLPPWHSIQTQWSTASRIHIGGLPPITALLQERNAVGSTLIPSEDRVVHRNTFDTSFNGGINPTLRLGRTSLTLNTGLQYTLRRDKEDPLDMNQNLFRQFVYLSTSSIANWLSLSGYGIHESGPFNLRNLHSRELGAGLEFRVGRPWGKTALITGYRVHDLLFRPLVREWFSTSSYAGLERQFGQRLKVRAIGEYVRGWQVQELNFALGQMARPVVSFDLRANKSWSVDGTFAYSRGMGFHAYDNFNSGLFVSYTRALRRTLDDGSGSIPVEYPIRFSAGFQQETFPNFTGSSQSTFVPVVRLTVF